MSELLLSIENSATSSSPLSFQGASSNVDREALPTVMPLAIPRDQLYYWTYVWQEGIRQSRAELAAGEYREFGNPRDAVRWLLSDEGD